MKRMNVARLSILGVALAFGGLAAYIASGPAEQPIEAPIVQQIDMDEVLVAASDIDAGNPINPGSLRWQAWPSAAISSAMISKAAVPNAEQDLAGAIARSSLLAGEPIRRDKLIKGEAGFMAAILPSGRRALAINIDSRGSTSAGGFILPNDKVDVLRTFASESIPGQGAAAMVSETILKNVRVLAIGQNIQEKGGEKVVVGETATLELDPGQVEMIVLAQRVGQLSLALRSIADNAKPDEDIQTREGPVTIVRYGISSQR
jgi:pilus assembly protein CpaB